jgi:hypothetical protein
MAHTLGSPKGTDNFHTLRRIIGLRTSQKARHGSTCQPVLCSILAAVLVVAVLASFQPSAIIQPVYAAPNASSLTITNIVQSSPTATSATVSYQAAANRDGTNVTPICNPSSGSVFPEGDNTVECSFQDTSGQQIDLEFKIRVDVTAPLVTGVSSTVADGAYNADDIIPITVMFSEPVTVTGTPQILLETGATDRQVSYTSGSGTTTLTFNYGVLAGDTSADLNYVATNSLTLNGGTIKDYYSNNAALTLPTVGGPNSLGGNKAIVIDTTIPTITLSTTAPNPTNTSPIPVTATFSESVTGFTLSDIVLGNGGASNLAGGPSIYTFSVTPPGQGLVTVNIPAGAAADPAGNGNTAAAQLSRTYDSQGPTVTGVSSTTADGTYNTGTIPITITFSESVTVTGSPLLALNTNPARSATYSNGSGTTTLTFDYVITAGDASADLNYVTTSSLTLNGGAIKDAVTNNAVLTLPATTAPNSLGGSKNIVIDAGAPTVASISSTAADGAYGTGSTIPITITFSKPVTVTGIPQLLLETGATDRQASYTSGSGTTTLTFSYEVMAGDASADLDYLAANSLTLGGGTIKDAAGNDAALNLPTPGAANSLGATKNIVIDTAVPGIASVSSTVPDSAYGVTAVIPITVMFSEPVTVTGTPQILLETGATDRQAAYTSGSGTTTLTFNYVVEAGDTSADLDYVATNSLTLSSGTIKDAANNEAVLTLPALGTAGSLGVNKDLVVDTTAPTASASPTGGTFSSSQSVILTSNEPSAVIYYTNDGSEPDLSSPVYTTAIQVTGTTTIKFYARDAAGNLASIVTEIYVIDSDAPTVTASPQGGSYNTAQSVTLTPSESATIYYTTNGDTPTTTSSVYSSAISITSTTTLKFFAVDSLGNSGTVVTELYTVDTVAPIVTASPAGGNYASSQSVTLSANEPAVIYYTTNGATPTESSSTYSSPIPISSTTTLKFFGKDAAGNSGNVVTQDYVIDSSVPVVAASPIGGTFGPAGTSVTLSANEPAVIYYTTNGATPTESSSTYSSPIPISSTTTLKFFGKDAAGNSGNVVTEQYTIDTIAPIVTPSPPGGTFGPSGTSVTLTANEPSTIYYTTNGATPTESSSTYSTAISITSTTTLKYFGKDTAGNSGTIQTQTYTIDNIPPTVTASPLGGTYTAAQSVTLSSNEPGTVIRYTTNGNDPTGSSPQYSGAISISADTTLKFYGTDSYGNIGSIITEIYDINAPSQPPGIVMEETTTTTGQSVWSGRQVHAEFVGPSSALVGKHIDSISISLKKVGSTPPGTAQVGIINSDLSMKKVFATITPSTLPTSYTSAEYALPAGDYYTIAAGDRIGIKYTAGTSSTYIAIMRDTTGGYDGVNTYHTTYTTGWNTFTSVDLTMTLKYSGASGGTNAAPVSNAGPDQTVNEGTLVTLTGLGSTDSDGTVASYAWSQTSGPAVTLSSTTASQPTFTAPSVSAATQLVFSLVVTDNDGTASTPDSVTVTVNDVTSPNNPPVSNAGPDQTVNEGTLVTLDGTGSTDSDGTVASYAWSQTSGPAVTLSSATAAQPTFTAPSVGAAGATLVFSLGVTDNLGASDATPDSVTVTVNNVNQPPVANAGPDQSVTEGALVTLTGLGSTDSDGTVASYLWSQTSGPAVSLSSTTASQPTFTAPSVSAATPLVFSLVVTDNQGLTDSTPDTVQVTVNDAAAQPPGIIMQTGTTTGQSVWSGRQVHAEFVGPSSSLVGKHIDSITLWLKKVGSTPPGTAEVGIINTDLSMKKVFATITPSTLPTSYTSAEYALPAGDYYTIAAGDRIGIKYTAGTSSTYIAIMRDTTGGYDGVNTYHTTYTTGWNTFTSVDLSMILEYSGGGTGGGGSGDTTPPTVSATPAGGTYTSSQSVTLSSNEPATIYYTTDGSTPSDTSSPEYTSPISITADTTLKFYGIDTAGNPSSVVTEVYDIETGGGGGTGQEPGIVMQDTTANTGRSIMSTRPVYAEYVDSDSVLVGKYIDSITVNLIKSTSATGIAYVGIINTDLSMKKVFAELDVSTLATSGYPPGEYALPSGDDYLIQAGDRIGVKYTGTGSDYVAIMRDLTPDDPFDGTNTHLTYYEGSWVTSGQTAYDLTMTLKLID